MYVCAYECRCPTEAKASDPFWGTISRCLEPNLVLCESSKRSETESYIQPIFYCFNDIYLFIYAFIYLVSTIVYMEVIWKISSLLTLYGPQELNSGCQLWRPVLLPIEPTLQVPQFFKSTELYIIVCMLLLKGILLVSVL